MAGGVGLRTRDICEDSKLRRRLAAVVINASDCVSFSCPVFVTLQGSLYLVPILKTLFPIPGQVDYNIRLYDMPVDRKLRSCCSRPHATAETHPRSFVTKTAECAGHWALASAASESCAERPGGRQRTAKGTNASRRVVPGKMPHDVA